MRQVKIRVKELESDLRAEHRRCEDSMKNLHKSVRRNKELTYQSGEDKRNNERMQAVVDELQMKIKSYKKQTKEGKKIAASNLAKVQQGQNNLTACEERADLNKQALVKLEAQVIEWG